MNDQTRRSIFELCKRRKGYREIIAEAADCSPHTVYNILRQIDVRYGAANNADELKAAVWDAARKLAEEQQRLISQINFGE